MQSLVTMSQTMLTTVDVDMFQNNPAYFNTVCTRVVTTATQALTLIDALERAIPHNSTSRSSTNNNNTNTNNNNTNTNNNNNRTNTNNNNNNTNTNNNNNSQNLREHKLRVLLALCEAEGHLAQYPVCLQHFSQAGSLFSALPNPKQAREYFKSTLPPVLARATLAHWSALTVAQLKAGATVVTVARADADTNSANILLGCIEKAEVAARVFDCVQALAATGGATGAATGGAGELGGDATGGGRAGGTQVQQGISKGERPQGPSLGAQSRGYSMLQRMGWTGAGSGLGELG
jgi:hypothetical protein